MKAAEIMVPDVIAATPGASVYEVMATMVAHGISGRPVVKRLKAEPWAAAELINLKVCDGEVEIWGMVNSPIEKKALRVAFESVPGVRATKDYTMVRPAVMGV